MIHDMKPLSLVSENVTRRHILAQGLDMLQITNYFL